MLQAEIRQTIEKLRRTHRGAAFHCRQNNNQEIKGYIDTLNSMLERDDPGKNGDKSESDNLVTVISLHCLAAAIQDRLLSSRERLLLFDIRNKNRILLKHRLSCLLDK